MIRTTGPQYIKLILANSVLTSELSFVTSWYDSVITQTGNKQGYSNGTNTKVIVGRPGEVIRTLSELHIENLDSAASTITLTKTDGVNSSVVYSGTLQPAQVLNYSVQGGFSIQNPQGFEPKIYKQTTEPPDAPDGALWVVEP